MLSVRTNVMYSSLLMSTSVVAPSALLTGSPEDVTNLISGVIALFDHHKELRYQHFLDKWKEMSFGHIFHGRDSFRELWEFTEDLLLLVKRKLVDAKEVSEKTAAVYLLYALYFKQPLVHKVRIKLSLSECQNINRFIADRRENQDWDIVHVWTKLVADHAFHYSAEGRVLGIEVALAIENRTKEKSEVFRVRANNPFLTHEFTEAFGRIAKMDEKYNAMKRALQDQMDIDSTEDHSLNLAQPGFSDRLKAIADHVYSDRPLVAPGATPDGNAGEGNVLVAADGSNIGDRRKELRNKAFGLKQEETRTERELKSFATGDTVNPVDDDNDADWDPETELQAAGLSRKGKKGKKGRRGKKGGAKKVKSEEI